MTAPYESPETAAAHKESEQIVRRNQRLAKQLTWFIDDLPKHPMPPIIDIDHPGYEVDIDLEVELATQILQFDGHPVDPDESERRLRQLLDKPSTDARILADALDHNNRRRTEVVVLLETRRNKALSDALTRLIKRLSPGPIPDQVRHELEQGRRVLINNRIAPHPQEAHVHEDEVLVLRDTLNTLIIAADQTICPTHLTDLAIQDARETLQ